VAYKKQQTKYVSELKVDQSTERLGGGMMKL
jgi:hypothetical protein